MYEDDAAPDNHPLPVEGPVRYSPGANLDPDAFKDDTIPY